MDSFFRKIWSRSVIPVNQRCEPPEFNLKVRQKGNLFLSQYGIPSKSSRFRSYWKDIASDLHRLYDGICAYTCTYLLPPASIDHFLPKSKYPYLAYEWSNYRLTSDRTNQRKGEKEGILDPFIVQRGWFTMDFPSCLVQTSTNIPEAYTQQAEDTIEILKLNDDDTLVQDRCDIIMEYVDGSVSLQFLHKRYPFVAIEIVRQDLIDTIGQVFRRRRTTGRA